MSFGRGMMGAAGTRVRGMTEQKTGTIIKQALVGSAAINVFVLGLIALWLLLGVLWTTPIVALVLWFIVLYLLIWLKRPPLQMSQALFALGFLLVVPVSAMLSRQLYDWMFAPELAAMFQVFFSVLAFPAWAWWIAVVLQLAVAVKLGPKRTWFIGPVAIFAYTVTMFREWSTVALLWQRIRYLLIPFLPAPMFFAAVLALVIFKELMFPNLEWTLQPVTLAELREIGLIGLWLPRVVSKWFTRPRLRTSQREELDITIHDNTAEPQPVIKMCRLFSPVGHEGNLARYAGALIRNDATRATFSYAGGKKINGAQFYGYTPIEFDELSTEAQRAGLVERKRENQPYTLTARGQFTFRRAAERGLGHLALSPTPEAPHERLKASPG